MHGDVVFISFVYGVMQVRQLEGQLKSIQDEQSAANKEYAKMAKDLVDKSNQLQVRQRKSKGLQEGSLPRSTDKFAFALT